MKRTQRLKSAVAWHSASFFLILGPATIQNQTQAQSDEPPRYAVFDLGDLGGDAGNAFAINDQGIVVGTAWFPGNNRNHAVAYRIGHPPYDLGTFGGPDSVAYDINNRNQIVGWAEGTDESRGAFVWQSNKMHPLGALGGNYSIAYGVNNAGQIVGTAETGLANLVHAFVWAKGQMADLGAFHGNSEAHDINESGVIIGTSSIPTGALESAVIWDGDKMIALGGIGGDYRSNGYGINDQNQAIGESKNDNYNTRAFVWSNGNMRNLQSGTPGIDWSVALGMNNQSQIVGSFLEYGGKVDLAFLWEPQAGFQYLSDAIPPLMPFRVARAYDINENGQIAALGVLIKGNWYRPLMLTPVTPELTLSDPEPGIANQINRWTITGAPPGSQVKLAYSLHGGGEKISDCDVLDAVMQLQNPTVVGSAIADSNGKAVVELLVPNAAQNLGDILFQALVIGDCQESQLSVINFQ